MTKIASETLISKILFVPLDTNIRDDDVVISSSVVRLGKEVGMAFEGQLPNLFQQGD
jgi:hypothetical protein